MEYKGQKKETKIQDALEYTQKLLDAVHEPSIILYDDLVVALANRAFYETFGVGLAETEGKFIYELGNRQWNIPDLRHLLEEILPKTTSFDNFEIEHDFLGIGRRIMLLNGCRIYMKANRTKLIILTIKDITEHKKIDDLKAKIKELELRIQRTPPHKSPGP